MTRRTAALRSAALVGMAGILAILGPMGLRSARSRARLPERVVDMWGVEHDLSRREWALFDFTHSAGCGYCVLNAGSYQENLADAFAGVGVSTFGVDVFEEQRDLVDYVKHNRIRFPILTEPDAIWSDLRCPGLPGQSLFHDGRLVMSQTETLTFRNFDRIRDELGKAGVPGLADQVPPFRPMGPLKKALNAVYEDEDALVIVGDGFPAEAMAVIPGMRKSVFRVKRAGEVSDSDLGAGAVYVIGSPTENAFVDHLRAQTPFEVGDDGVAFADTLLQGNDLLLWYCYPNPWNPERYLVVRTGTFPMTRLKFGYDASQDFVVERWPHEDGASPTIVARGMLEKRNGDWTLTRDEVVWSGSSQDEAAVSVAACGPLGCPAPEPAPVGALDTAGGRDVEVESLDWSIEAPLSWPGRFPALSAVDDATCWIAWDRPQSGVYVARLGDGIESLQRLWAGSSAGLPGVVPVGADTPNTIDAFKPAVLADGVGGCWVAWSEMEGGHYQVYVARVSSEASTEMWRVSHRANLDQHAPSLARNALGDVTVAWYAWEANARRPYSRTWRGGKWSDVDRVPTHEASQFAWYSSGAVAGDAGSRFVWMQHYPTPTAIVSARLDGGEWREPELIAAAGRYPSIAFDPRTGETRVVWQQWMVDQSNRGRSGRMRNEWRILTSSSRGQGWSDPELVPACPPGRNVTPVVAVDGSGDSWVFWSHKDPMDDDGPVAGTGPRTWRVLCSVAGSGGWRGPVTVSDPRSDARSPAVAASGGAVWIAWHEGTGADLRTVVRRMRSGTLSSGTRLDTKDGEPADRRAADGTRQDG